MEESGIPRGGDFREIGYEELVDFVFGHPVPEEPTFLARDGFAVSNPARPKEWYWGPGLWTVQLDPVRQLGHMARLMREPAFLAERFSSAQVEQGFQFMFGPGGVEMFTGFLWDEQVPATERKAVFAATVPLYEHLFDPLDAEFQHVPWMLWDMLLDYRYRLGKEGPPVTAGEEQVRGWALGALRGMFALNGAASVPAAMHGIHHVNHPAGYAMLEKYLKGRPSGGPAVREYGWKVMRGEAL